MRKYLLLFLIFSDVVLAEDSIRSFPVETIAALGRELFRRDQMAAIATDVLMAGQPEAREVPIKGWITEPGVEKGRVYFVQKEGAQLSLAYVVTFPEKGEPRIEDQRGAALPPYVATRYAARESAIAAIPKFMKAPYNFEVLDAPDGKGFLVYALAATTEPDEIIVGGHYRVSVSADGSVQQVDPLSRSFVTLQKSKPGAPKDAKVEGMMMTHLVSSTPVETHVFLSLLHSLPFYVTTPDRVIWKVSEGKITKAD